MHREDREASRHFAVSKGNPEPTEFSRMGSCWRAREDPRETAFVEGMAPLRWRSGEGGASRSTGCSPPIDQGAVLPSLVFGDVLLEQQTIHALFLGLADLADDVCSEDGVVHH